MRLTLNCPAKINLFLAVGPRDRRGYHPLRTIFQAIDLQDTLTVETGVEKTEFLYDVDWLPEENTLTKALRLAGEVTNLPPLRITLQKRIPAESGLGGGSSDAAALLRALKKLSPAQVPDAEWASIALAVGADVPFFLCGGAARAEGYGERITPLEDLPESWYVIIRPGIGCSTPKMYQLLDNVEYEWKAFPTGSEVYNDFARVAPPACLNRIDALKTLGALDSTLCGSGSAVFGRFLTQRDAQIALSSLSLSPSENAWIARSLARQECLQTVVN